MNGTPSDDRISAWLDDELPLDERAETEQQLAGSPEMRQDADELRQVSELVRGLPTERAPSELQAAVMRTIERDTLLAGTVPGAARSVRVSRLLSVAAVAVLLVGVALLFRERGGEPRPDDRPEIVERSVAPTEVQAEKRQEPRPSDVKQDDESERESGGDKIESPDSKSTQPE
jgi:anti-sigma factor RsiW